MEDVSTLVEKLWEFGRIMVEEPESVPDSLFVKDELARLRQQVDDIRAQFNELATDDQDISADVTALNGQADLIKDVWKEAPSFSLDGD
jgi:hypothetical protein